ncbi:hypothetical protein [Bifidobacterium choerinum]|uniref:hypothetical protein n=1 Tax=Bifidobacterium choerinum TaxID=35760 RepID=UPI003F90936B
MACRNMEVGDIVVVDTSDVNALGIVTEISGDGEKTGGVGDASKGRWAYGIRVLRGVRRADGTSMPTGAQIWVDDDPWRVHVDGEDGYALPESYQGESVARLLAKAGVERRGMTPDEERALSRRRRRGAVIRWIVAVVCVVAIVMGAGVLAKHHRKQAAERQRQERLDGLVGDADSYALKLLRRCGGLQTISTGLGVQYATVAPSADGLDSATLGCMLESMGEEDTGANEVTLWRALIDASIGNLVTNPGQLVSLPWQSVMGIEVRCGIDFDGRIMCDVRSADGSFGENGSSDGASPDGQASNEPMPADASTTTSDNSGEVSSWTDEFDPDNVRGRWCLKDGVTCVVITPQVEGQRWPLALDTAQMGDANPLPDGQTSTLMAPNYQDVQEPETLRQQLRMVTEYTYRIDCSTQPDDTPCDGQTVRKPTYDQTTGAPGSAGIVMVREPLELVRVGPDNTLPVDGLDESNPPAQVAYLIIKPYGKTQPGSISNDTVFYSRLT